MRLFMLYCGSLDGVVLSLFLGFALSEEDCCGGRSLRVDRQLVDDQFHLNILIS